jgi:hypothetical protein
LEGGEDKKGGDNGVFKARRVRDKEVFHRNQNTLLAKTTMREPWPSHHHPEIALPG